MINEQDNFNVITGTVDNKKPKSLYVNISAWVEPQINKEINYKSVIKDLNKKIKSKIYLHIDSKLFHNNKNIIDFDMRESGITFGKRTYMGCEIILFQLNSFKIQDKIIQDSLNELVNKLIEDVFNTDIYFTYHKTK